MVTQSIAVEAEWVGWAAKRQTTEEMQTDQSWPSIAVAKVLAESATVALEQHSTDCLTERHWANTVTPAVAVAAELETAAEVTAAAPSASLEASELRAVGPPSRDRAFAKLKN